MDVILLKDIEKLGAGGAIVHIKPGFARNYLLPLGLAVEANPEQLRAVEAMRRQQLQKRQRLEAAAQALKQKLEARSLTLKLTLGADGKPFGSVTVHEIVDTLKRDGIEIEKHAVQLDQPIKTLGIFDVPIRLQPDVTATLKVWVVKA